MPFLSVFLQGVFGALIGLFSKWLTSKAAVIAAALTVFAAALVALWSSLKLTLGAITYVLPDSEMTHFVLMGFNLVLPDNWEMCLSAMLATDTAVYLYRWNMAHVMEPAQRG